jgi:flagellar basal body-associated protein FliL
MTISREPVPEGLKAWLPALVVLIGMPLLALATTKYVLLPSLKHPYAQVTGSTTDFAGDSDPSAAFFAKIPFNTSDTTNAHSDIRALTLVGDDNAFKGKINQNKVRLTDLAARDLHGKTTSDLDQPGELDATRARLLAEFNHVLGGPVVKEVYIAVSPPR